MQRLKAVTSPIERYLQLRTLAVQNIPEYYKLLLNHTEEVRVKRACIYVREPRLSHSMIGPVTDSNRMV